MTLNNFKQTYSNFSLISWCKGLMKNYAKTMHKQEKYLNKIQVENKFEIMTKAILIFKWLKWDAE